MFVVVVVIVVEMHAGGCGGCIGVCLPGPIVLSFSSFPLPFFSMVV